MSGSSGSSGSGAAGLVVVALVVLVVLVAVVAAVWSSRRGRRDAPAPPLAIPPPRPLARGPEAESAPPIAAMTEHRRAVEVAIAVPGNLASVRAAVSRGLAALAQQASPRGTRRPDTVAALAAPATANLIGGHGARLIGRSLLLVPPAGGDLDTDPAPPGGIVHVVATASALPADRLWLIEVEPGWRPATGERRDGEPDAEGLAGGAGPGAGGHGAAGRGDGSPMSTGLGSPHSGWVDHIAAAGLDLAAIAREASEHQDKARSQALESLAEAASKLERRAEAERERRDEGREVAVRDVAAGMPGLGAAPGRDDRRPGLESAAARPARGAGATRAVPSPAVWLYDLNAPLDRLGRPPAAGSLPAAGGVVGRSERADVTIPSPAVSHKHLRIEPTPAGWAIRDLDSMNGTFVNGSRVTSPQLLVSYDQIELGSSVRLRFVIGSGDPAITPSRWVPEA